MNVQRARPSIRLPAFLALVVAGACSAEDTHRVPSESAARTRTEAKTSGGAPAPRRPDCRCGMVDRTSHRGRHQPGAGPGGGGTLRRQPAHLRLLHATARSFADPGDPARRRQEAPGHRHDVSRRPADRRGLPQLSGRRRRCPRPPGRRDNRRDRRRIVRRGRPRQEGEAARLALQRAIADSNRTKRDAPAMVIVIPTLRTEEKALAALTEELVPTSP